MKIITNNDFDCYDVAEMSGIKRGITIDGKTLEEIKSEAIKDFAKWLTKSDYANGYFDTENGFVSIDKVIAKYDMEYENDN